MESHSCDSLKCLEELPVIKESHFMSRSVGESDTLEPLCCQILTSGPTTPDESHVLRRDSNRINIFDLFSSVINPKQNCSDFDDHISLVHLTKFISSPKTTNTARKKHYEHKTGTKPSKTIHSLNQNVVKFDCQLTQSLKKLKEKRTKLKSSQINKNLKLNKIINKKARLHNNNLKHKVRLADQVVDKTDIFSSDEKKTEHAGNLAQCSESPPVTKGTNKRSMEGQYHNSSWNNILMNASQMINPLRILNNHDHTINSDTESATSDYDKSSDKIPTQLLYINERTYFRNQNPFDKKKVLQSNLNSFSFTQTSVDSIGASNRANVERTDSLKVQGPGCGKFTKYLATKSSWKYYSQLRSKKEQKKLEDSIEIKTHVQSRKNRKQFKKQLFVPREKNQYDENRGWFTKKGKQSFDEQIVMVNNGVLKGKKSTKKKKNSRETTNDNEMLKKRVKPVISEYTQISKVKKKSNPVKNIGGDEKENSSILKTLHDQSSYKRKECLPKCKSTQTNSSASKSAVKKDTDNIVMLQVGQQINIAKASHLEFSSCHLCKINCKDKTETPYISGDYFPFKTYLKSHIETCILSDDWSEFCKKHQQNIEIIDLAIRSMLEPFQNKIDALKTKKNIHNIPSENVVRASPVTCIIVEDEYTESCFDLETSVKSSLYIDLLKPYIKIYSNAELMTLSSDDF